MVFKKKIITVCMRYGNPDIPILGTLKLKYRCWGNPSIPSPLALT